MEKQIGLKGIRLLIGLLILTLAWTVDSSPVILNADDPFQFQISQAWALQFDAEMGRDSMNLETAESVKKREIAEELNLGLEMDELQMPLVPYGNTINSAPRKVRQTNYQPYRDASPAIRDHNW